MTLMILAITAALIVILAMVSVIASDPYQKGVDDYYDGLSLSDNPFKYGTPKCDDWNRGYTDEKREDTKPV